MFSRSANRRVRDCVGSSSGVVSSSTELDEMRSRRSSSRRRRLGRRDPAGRGRASAPHAFAAGVVFEATSSVRRSAGPAGATTPSAPGSRAVRTRMTFLHGRISSPARELSTVPNVSRERTMSRPARSFGCRARPEKSFDCVREPTMTTEDAMWRSCRSAGRRERRRGPRRRAEDEQSHDRAYRGRGRPYAAAGTRPRRGCRRAAASRRGLLRCRRERASVIAVGLGRGT